MKSIVKLDVYYIPSELEHAIASFVDYYNSQRYHELLDNVTPAAVFFGKRKELVTRRQPIKQQTLQKRRQHSLQQAPFSAYQ